MTPTRGELHKALAAAGSAHHEFETSYLHGERDELWSGWYAAYVLGRLGDFTEPTRLARWLEAVSSEPDWFENAARDVAAKLEALGES